MNKADEVYQSLIACRECQKAKCICWFYFGHTYQLALDGFANSFGEIAKGAGKLGGDMSAALHNVQYDEIARSIRRTDR